MDPTPSLDNWEGTWLIDGRPSEIALPGLAPGEATVVVMTATFQEPGLHHVSLKLPADDLLGDNQRWEVVDVKDNARMQLVDGEPSTDPFQSETDFLALALSLPIGESKAFQVEVVTDTEWATSAKSDPDLIVLANVATLNATHADMLRKLVEGGTGLLMFSRATSSIPTATNRSLFRDGSGILPVQLEAPTDEPVTGLILERQFAVSRRFAFGNSAPPSSNASRFISGIRFACQPSMIRKCGCSPAGTIHSRRPP